MVKKQSEYIISLNSNFFSVYGLSNTYSSQMENDNMIAGLIIIIFNFIIII